MFSLPYLIARLYPGDTEEDQQKKVDRAFELAPFSDTEWVAQEWGLLSGMDTQLRIARTVYETAQGGDPGIVLRIMDALELWADTEPYALSFSFLEPHVYVVYERLYTIIGFLFFHLMGNRRQEFLLNDRFLPLACAMEIPVYVSVQQYFATFASIKLMKDDAGLFWLSTYANLTPIGTEGRTVKPIRDWIHAFNQFPISSVTDHVDQFMENNMEAARLDESARTILRKILTLSFGLKGGFIWNEISNVQIPGYSKKTNKEGKSVSDYYLQNLYKKASNEDFISWLADYKDVVEWVKGTGKDISFLQKLLFVVRSRVDLKDQNQIQNALHLLQELKKDGGPDNIDEVLYFDEKAGAFVWDDAYFVSLEDQKPMAKPTSTAQTKK